MMNYPKITYLNEDLKPCHPGEKAVAWECGGHRTLLTSERQILSGKCKDVWITCMHAPGTSAEEKKMKKREEEVALKEPAAKAEELEAAKLKEAAHAEEAEAVKLKSESENKPLS